MFHDTRDFDRLHRGRHAGLGTKGKAADLHRAERCLFRGAERAENAVHGQKAFRDPGKVFRVSDAHVAVCVADSRDVGHEAGRERGAAVRAAHGQRVVLRVPRSVPVRARRRKG